MHALENLHAALRPAGSLLDVRPAPRHPQVEVQQGDGVAGRECVVPLGQVDDSYRHGTLANASAALQAQIDAGRFVRERMEPFTFVYHFESVDAWLAYVAERWSSAQLDPELIARAHEALPAGATGEVRVLRVIHAARLRRA